jgi:hypothetical protein
VSRVGPVVAGVDHEGVVGDPGFLEGVEDLAHAVIVLDHDVCEGAIA